MVTRLCTYSVIWCLWKILHVLLPHNLLCLCVHNLHVTKQWLGWLNILKGNFVQSPFFGASSAMTYFKLFVFFCHLFFLKSFLVYRFWVMLLMFGRFFINHVGEDVCGCSSLKSLKLKNRLLRVKKPAVCFLRCEKIQTWLRFWSVFALGSPLQHFKWTRSNDSELFCVYASVSNELRLF